MTPEAIYRRAGGRRRYNATRRRLQADRRVLVTAALLATGAPCMVDYGWPARLARTLGVHHSQISRDLAAIRPTLELPDPCCDHHRRMQEEEDRMAERLLAAFFRGVGRRR